MDDELLNLLKQQAQAKKRGNPEQLDAEDDLVEEEKATGKLQEEDWGNEQGNTKFKAKTKREKVSKGPGEAVSSSGGLPLAFLSGLEYADPDRGDAAVAGSKRKRELDGDGLGSISEPSKRGRHSTFEVEAEEHGKSERKGSVFSFPTASSPLEALAMSAEAEAGTSAAAAALRLKHEHFFGSRLKRAPIGKSNGFEARRATSSETRSSEASSGKLSRGMRQKLKHRSGNASRGERKSVVVLDAVMRSGKGNRDSKGQKAGNK